MSSSIAVVIPCYKVGEKIFSVLQAIGPEVQQIYVVDDACPQHTGELVRKSAKDPRVKVLFMEKNGGVGAATLRGFQEAFREGHTIFVKMDGDGQMDPLLLPVLVEPIQTGRADYTKGNRFYSPRALQSMPLTRKLGNTGISFLSKLASGYWQMMDPTNGYIALQRNLFPFLDADKIAPRFFFENDLLFRLSLLRAVVSDIPMEAIYGDEKSNLNIWHALFSFPGKFLARTGKRILYRYFIRDFNPASLFLCLGTFLLLAGGIFGGIEWIRGIYRGVFASSGTVMLSALPVLVGFQLLLFFFLYDIITTPTEPVAAKLEAMAKIWGRKI